VLRKTPPIVPRAKRAVIVSRAPSDKIDAAAYAVLEAEEWWGVVKVERVFG
jgi:hypothetical protein